MKQLSFSLFLLCLVSIFFQALAIAPKPMEPKKEALVIVIHGTWGHESQWYLEEGDFFKALAQKLQQKRIKLLSFTWSGRNSHVSRLLAGKQLKRLIESYSSDIEIYLISHSHGGNVAALATQLLAENPENAHRIKAMLNLGTPIDVSRYVPDYSVVDFVINMFSFNDLVQTVWGHCKREYPVHEYTANLRTRINGQEPNHSQLHSAVIAQWIPTIIQQLTKDPIPMALYQTPMTIEISHDKEPAYSTDHWRKIDIKIDEGIKFYRGTGTNSTWETFFRVLFNFTPGAFTDQPDNEIKPSLSLYLRQVIRRCVKLLKITKDTLFSPLYD